MIRFSKVRTVALFEFLSTIKRKGYLIATFGMPLFILLYGGLISVIGYFTHQAENQLKVFGVVDETGFLDLASEVTVDDATVPAQVREALVRMGQSQLLAGPLAIGEQAVFRPFVGEDQAREALRHKTVTAYYVLPRDYLTSGRVDEYRSQEPGFPQGSSGRSSLRRLILDGLLEGRVSDDLSQRIRQPIAELKSWTVDDTGQPAPSSLGAVIARLVVPIAFTMLLFISLMISASYLVQGTALEKENKVVEVILASVNPEEILGGKLLGLGGAGLLQVAVWFGMIIFGGVAFATTLAAFGVEIPWLAMGVGLILFVTGYLFLGSLMLGAGSLGSNQRESQQFSAVWTLLAVLPMMFMGVFIQNPHHPAAMVMTWIPFTAPVMVLLRLSLDPPGVAWWELGGSLGVMLVSIWLALSLGARLFRIGLLLTGARPKLREILRQARLNN